MLLGHVPFNFTSKISSSSKQNSTATKISAKQFSSPKWSPTYLKVMLDTLSNIAAKEEFRNFLSVTGWNFTCNTKKCINNWGSKYVLVVLLGKLILANSQRTKK